MASHGVPRIGIIRRAISRLLAVGKAPVRPVAGGIAISMPLRFPSLLNGGNIGSLIQFHSAFKGKFVFNIPKRSLAVGALTDHFENIAQVAIGAHIKPMNKSPDLVSGSITLGVVSGSHNIEFHIDTLSGTYGAGKDPSAVHSYLQDILKKIGYSQYSISGASQVGEGAFIAKFINPSNISKGHDAEYYHNSTKGVVSEVAFIWTPEFKKLSPEQKSSYTEALKERITALRNEIRSASLPEKDKKNIETSLYESMKMLFE